MGYYLYGSYIGWLPKLRVRLALKIDFQCVITKDVEENALAIARTAVTVKFTTINNGTVDGVTPVTGDVIYSGSAFIESVDMTADMENPVTYSVSFKGTGVLTIATNA